MKLVYLIPKFPIPSETFVSREVLNLLAAGIDVRVISFGKFDEKIASILEKEVLDLVRQRVQYISLKDSFLATIRYLPLIPNHLKMSLELHKESTHKANFFIRLGRAFAIAELSRFWHIDHIHAHWPYATQIAMLVHHITGIPYSVSIHAHEVAHDNKHFPIAFKQLQFAAFCNKAAMDYLLQNLDACAASKSHLIYHGVDVSKFSFEPMISSWKPLRIVSAGRLTRSKGFDKLIKACAKAYSSGVDLHLTILGSGSEFHNLQALAEKLNFHSNLEMPGWVNHENLKENLKQSHIFALMADKSYHDGLPNVVLEALAIGRPTILSTFPAATEVITDGKEGFIVDIQADTERLTKVLEMISMNPQELVLMGMQAHERIIKDYNDKIHIKKMIDLFAKSVQAQGRNS